MIGRPDAGLRYKTGKYPCGVCLKGVGSNSIKCLKCKQWVHARCSGVRGKLSKVNDFICGSCLNQTTIQSDTVEKITIGDSSYEIVSQFCYLGDMISAGGGAEASSVTRTRCAWKKFRELLPLLTSRALSLKKKGSLYNACVRSGQYRSETWPVKEEDLARLHRTDMSMLRWMAHVTVKDRKSATELLGKFQLHPIRSVVQRSRLRWFGHVERMKDDNWVKKCRNLEVAGKRSQGRPRKTWEQVIEADLHSSRLNREMAQDRKSWKSKIAMNSPTHASVE